MGANRLEGFLSVLTAERKLSTSLHRLALGECLLYEEALGITLPYRQDTGRPASSQRILLMLTAERICQMLTPMIGVIGLLPRQRSSARMRLPAALTLRR